MKQIRCKLIIIKNKDKTLEMYTTAKRGKFFVENQNNVLRMKMNNTLYL